MIKQVDNLLEAENPPKMQNPEKETHTKGTQAAVGTEQETGKG